MRPRFRYHPDDPLSAHEIMRAHTLVHRLSEVLADKTGYRFKEHKELLMMLPRWIESQKEYPHARQHIRYHLANPPRLLTP